MISPHTPAARFLILVFIVFSFANDSRAGTSLSYDHLLDKSFAENCRSLDSIRLYVLDADYDQALSFLNQKEIWAEEKRDEALHYSFKVLKLNFLLDRDTARRERYEKDYNNLVLELDERGLNALRAYALFIFSQHYWYKKEYGLSFQYAMRAHDVYSGMPADVLPQKSRYLYLLAVKYYQFRDYKRAKDILFETLNTSPLYEQPSRYNILNLMGLCYRKAAIYDSAGYYFMQAYSEAVKEKKTAWKGIISGNLGITYYCERRFEEAIPLLEYDIEICLGDRAAERNTIKSLAILGDIYLEKGDLQRATSLLTQSFEVIEKTNAWDMYEALEVVYPIMAKAYKLNGDMNNAYAFMDSAITVKTKFAQENSALILARTQQIIGAERYRASIAELDKEKKIQTIIRNSLIIISLLAGVIGLLFINRMKILHRRRTERLNTQIVLADKELASAVSQLALFTKSIHEKNQLIEKFETELEEVKQQHHLDNTETEEILQQLQESTILTDEEWDNFRKLFEKVHGGYLGRLKEKIPGMTPADMRFMALNKLGFSNKEMAGILGISTDAVRMSKHRIRKKLNLAADESIDAIVEEM